LPLSVPKLKPYHSLQVACNWGHNYAFISPHLYGRIGSGDTNMTTMSPSQDILAVSIREAAQRLSVSPRTVATLVARKELASRRIGRRRVIPVRALEEFLRRDHPTRIAKNGCGRITPAPETHDGR